MTTPPNPPEGNDNPYGGPPPPGQNPYGATPYPGGGEYGGAPEAKTDGVSIAAFVTGPPLLRSGRASSSASSASGAPRTEQRKGRWAADPWHRAGRAGHPGVDRCGGRRCVDLQQRR